MGRTFIFVVRQALLSGLAALAYFAVRGVTESDPSTALRNAGWVLRLERSLHLDLELGAQALFHRNDLLIDLANWIYIWGHWPLIIVTLVALATTNRPAFFELRNAMFISGAIGLGIFAIFAVAPPRLFGPEYVDTVTNRSISYRVLQPPALVNKYAAVPSLHFGWNLLLGWTWAKTTTGRLGSIAGMIMPLAMAFAVVVTANHWTLDVVVGGLVAACGLAIEQRRSGSMARPRSAGLSRLGGPDQRPVARSWRSAAPRSRA